MIDSGYPTTERLPVITVKPVEHYGEWKTGIFFTKDYNIQQMIRRVFSKSCSGWVVASRPSLPEELRIAVGGCAVVHDETKGSKAQIDDIVCPADFIDLLTRKRYSESTIRNYSAQLVFFLRYFSDRSIDSLGETEIRAYMQYLIKERNVSISTQNVVINSIKFYYEKVRGNDRMRYAFERPVKERKLPVVFSKDEIERLLNACENLKHRTLLLLIYSSGLRRSEAINLRLKDIDLSLNQIDIRGAKGKKDRNTVLSKKLVSVLETY